MNNKGFTIIEFGIISSIILLIIILFINNNNNSNTIKPIQINNNLSYTKFITKDDIKCIWASSTFKGGLSCNWSE